MRTYRLSLESSLAPADLVTALERSAANVDHGTPFPLALWDTGAAFRVVVDGQRITIVVSPHVRRFGPRFVGTVDESDGGSVLIGALGPAPLARGVWYALLACALWVPIGSLIFARSHGFGWGLAAVAATVMGGLSAGILALQHWAVWGSTIHDRAAILTILQSAGSIRDSAAHATSAAALDAHGV